MYWPSFCSTAKGSLVYEYLADAAVFHALMAAEPTWVTPSSLTTACVVKQRATDSPSRLSASKYAAIGSGRFSFAHGGLLGSSLETTMRSLDRLENHL